MGLDPAAFGRLLLDQSAVAVRIRHLDGSVLVTNAGFEAMLAATEAVALDAAEQAVIGRGVAQSFDVFPGDGDGGGGRRHGVAFPLGDSGGALFAVGTLIFETGGGDAVLDELRAALAGAERTNEELRRSLVELEHIAATDRLTGAWNRRRFEDMAVIEMSRAERYGQPVTMLLLDLDRFKLVNDALGHAIGDAVLQEFVRRVNRAVRKADILARWGGEEFVVMAPNTPLAEAMRLADKLRRRIEAASFHGAPPQTISIGVAEYQRGEGLDGWLLRADRALYTAKDSGRNRVVADPLTCCAEPAASYRAGSVLQLVWREHYESGHPLIDAQHRRLFEVANRLLDEISRQAAVDDLIDVVVALLDEIARHFADEEAIQREIGYPDAARHADEHAQLLARATRLKQYVSKGTMAANDLFQFLAYEVIAQHLLGADRSYYRYLNRVDVQTPSW